MKNAKNLDDVMTFLDQATKGTSTLPEAMSETRTSELMESVLRTVADNQNLRKKLSNKILEAKTPTDVADAFTAIREEADLLGVQDPEVKLKIKLDSIAKGFINKAGITIGEIKREFNQAANAAKSEEEVEKAYESASTKVLNALGSIEGQMKSQIEA